MGDDGIRCGCRFRGNSVLSSVPYRRLPNWVLFCPEAGGLWAYKIPPCLLIFILQTHLSLALPVRLAQKVKARFHRPFLFLLVPSPVLFLPQLVSWPFTFSQEHFSTFLDIQCNSVCLAVLLTPEDTLWHIECKRSPSQLGPWNLWSSLPLSSHTWAHLFSQISSYTV